MTKSTVNPRNQGGLRYLFETIDPKSNPESIDMDTIQPVIDMSFGGLSKLSDYSNLDHAQQLGDSIAGVVNVQRNIISYGSIVGADPQIIIPVGYNTVFWGIKNHVQFTAAGALAFNGKFITSVIKLYEPTGIDMDKVFDTMEVKTNIRIYQRAVTRDELCIIPAGCRVALFWLSQDGTAFPAGTTIDYKVIVQSFPIGAPLPIGI